ncbi:WGR domain-containing protein [Tabrizicola sp.]|uniref:WGR domain-containing protein n=1 Tax=Tabrizicola sp. TaxID=2005166 RepID=UPI0035AEB7A2
MARFYRIEVLPDLFGQVIAEGRRGRFGGRGQYRVASCLSICSAEADMMRT